MILCAIYYLNFLKSAKSASMSMISGIGCGVIGILVCVVLVYLNKRTSKSTYGKCISYIFFLFRMRNYKICTKRNSFNCANIVFHFR